MSLETTIKSVTDLQLPHVTVSLETFTKSVTDFLFTLHLSIIISPETFTRSVTDFCWQDMPLETFTKSVTDFCLPCMAVSLYHRRLSLDQSLIFVGLAWQYNDITGDFH